jgi:hypothetical protein
VIGSSIASRNDWLVYPSGKITFSKPPESGVTYQIYYTAEWDKPTDANDVSFELETPTRYDNALALWATGYILHPQTVAQSNLGQFDTRLDSGTPEDNPLMKQAKWMWQLFEVEMSRFAAHQRAQVTQ